MTITRMQEPRQLYGLGSLVKKITKPIKKIVKSPIGKAALLIGGAGLTGVGSFAGLRTRFRKLIYLVVLQNFYLELVHKRAMKGGLLSGFLVRLNFLVI